MITFKVLNMISGSSSQIIHFEISAQLFKTLIHPTRLAILNILRDGEHCVCHMEAHLGLRQANISQQLSVLREAGLIADRRDGWNIYYRVLNPRIYLVLDAAQAVVGENSASILEQKEVFCPCPQCTTPAKGD